MLSKNVFLNKMEEFDYLIGDKEKKVDELNETILEKEGYITDLEQKIDESSNITINKDSSKDVVLPKYVDLDDDNVLSSYKVIKKAFSFDTKAIIEHFINQIDNTNNNKYELYLKIRSYFTYDVIFKLSTYQEKEQLIIIKELLSEEEKTILSKYLNKSSCNVNRFVRDLDHLILKNNPEIRVYVGDPNENYNYMNSNINTIYDKSIVEGFKIVYKGIIYDYSI